MAQLVSGTNNTILITGGATGIGYALAEALIKHGNTVIITGRREDRLKEAQTKLGPNSHYRVNDVATPQERVALVNKLTTDFPTLNAVILNAGIQKDVDFKPEGSDDWDFIREEIAINLDAPIHMSKLFIPHLLKQGRQAFLMTVTSGLAFAPLALFPIYCATKAGIHNFSLSLRIQLRGSNIKVIEIVPPAVDSELNSVGRAKRNITSTGTTSEQFAAGVLEGFKKDEDEIGYGMSNMVRNGSRADVDRAIGMLNKI